VIAWSGPAPGLVGSSAEWLEISQKVADLAATGGHVLITGERGVGKRHVALTIAGLRRLTPAVVDAAAAGDTGVAQWLEGVARRLAELSDGAVMVVVRLERVEPSVRDELAELLGRGPVPSLATAVRPDPRATARHPLDALTVFADRVHIPALRHRPDDVGPLARHFDARHGAGELVWTSEALEIMERYLWPGNARELEHTVQGLLAHLAPTAVVAADQLPGELLQRVRRGPLTRLEEAEIDVMLAALAEAEGNKDVAAHLIGIHRATLYRKLQNYGLDWPPEG
jgi:DNA-binding NtrC family response regulator